MFFSTLVIFSVTILADNRLFLQQQHERGVKKHIKLMFQLFSPLNSFQEFALWTVEGSVVICLCTHSVHLAK